jgi:hypothetical protein
MNRKFSVLPNSAPAGIRAAVLIVFAGMVAPAATAQDWDDHSHHELRPGNLLVSRSVYDDRAYNVVPGTVLPPDCPAASGSCGAASGAPDNGTYPFVWNNDGYDASFGITSRIFLDQITPVGQRVSTIEVPNSLQPWVGQTTDQLVTSFSSKSELALNLSTDRKYITFMGYYAPVNALDVSNSNTLGVVDNTNPDGLQFERAVAAMDRSGKFTFTLTNAYSGNNGRAAIWNNTNGANVVYMAGNAGNGSNPQPVGVIEGAGAQILTPSTEAESSQTVGQPTPLASFSVTELGDPADKIGKDDNFRGLTVFNNVVYFTKGSGGNGVNTVYFVDTTGTACPNGTGLPAAGAKLPNTALNLTGLNVQKTGLPNNMCVLKGFPTLSNKNPNNINPVNFPFGLWFADAKTLYVADEGDGTNTYDSTTNTYTDAAGQTNAGLEKWVLDTASNTWTNVYTLQKGLDLGIPYKVPEYEKGLNAATGLPWAPATDGLRNITGEHLPFGLVVIYGISSTVSGNGDQGADPNKLFAIVDEVQSTSASAASWERFFAVRKARNLEVLRGVSFTPDTPDFNF